MPITERMNLELVFEQRSVAGQDDGGRLNPELDYLEERYVTEWALADPAGLIGTVRRRPEPAQKVTVTPALETEPEIWNPGELIRLADQMAHDSGLLKRFLGNLEIAESSDLAGAAESGRTWAAKALRIAGAVSRFAEREIVELERIVDELTPIEVFEGVRCVGCGFASTHEPTVRHADAERACPACGTRLEADDFGQAPEVWEDRYDTDRGVVIWGGSDEAEELS